VGGELFDKFREVRDRQRGEDAAGFSWAVLVVCQFEAFEGFAVVAPDFVYAQCRVNRLAGEGGGGDVDFDGQLWGGIFLQVDTLAASHLGFVFEVVALIGFEAFGQVLAAKGG